MTVFSTTFVSRMISRVLLMMMVVSLPEADASGTVAVAASAGRVRRYKPEPRQMTPMTMRMYAIGFINVLICRDF